MTYILPLPSQLLEIPFESIPRTEIPEQPDEIQHGDALIACIPVASTPGYIEVVPILTREVAALVPAYLEISGREDSVTYYLVDLKEFTEMIANTLNELHA